MSKNIEIVDYQPIYKKAFKALNVAWISTYFEMEEADYKALDHPQTYILDKGGYIAIALLNEVPVGTCALLKMNHEQFDFELAKMAVSPEAQGLGIGHQLGKKVIEKAKALGARSLFLESNTKLQPALRLYKKLGFQEMEHIPTPYERCDIQMQLNLQ